MIRSPIAISADAVAAHYDSLDLFYRQVWGEHVHHGYWETGTETTEEAVLHLSRVLADWLSLKADDSVCDIGCGYGGSSRFLAENYRARVRGYTLSQKQKDYADGVPVRKGNVSILCQDFMRNREADESFDAIFSVECIEHIPDKAALFQDHSVGTGVIEELQTDYPGYTGRIPKEKGTFVEGLRQNHYSTAGFGKWHNTPPNEVTRSGPYDLWPSGQGFEHWYGFLSGDTSQWEPNLWENKEPVAIPVDDPNYHLTIDLADQAIKWLGQQKKESPDQPFFLYFATGATHAPHHAPRDYIDKYKGKFDQGWDKVREEILAKQIKMGVVPANTVLSTRPDVIPSWDSLSDVEKRVYTRMQEVHAAYLEHADAQFGRVLDAIEKAGQMDNTIVIVTSDNGASGEGGLQGAFSEITAFNGQENSLLESSRKLDEIGSKTAYNLYPAGWALAGNTPFKYFKQVVHEGGVHDPFIIAWPQMIKERGVIRNQFTHMNDIAATIYELTGITPPSELNGVKQEPLEGVSFAKTLFDKNEPTAKTEQYFEMLGNRGIWIDGWKAVTFHGRYPWDLGTSNPNFDADVWELYDLSNDFSEMNDLAKTYPDKLKSFQETWDQEARMYNVYPLDDTTSSRVQATYASFTEGVTNFHYTQDDFRIPEALSPPIKQKSHTIDVVVDIPDAGAEGVLVTCGGRFAGFSLFMKDGRLHYVYNYFGRTQFEAVSNDPVPAGRSELKFVFKKGALLSAQGEMYINGKSVATLLMPLTVPGAFSISETFDVGRDTGTPIGDMYSLPFAFTGKIEDLTVSMN